MPKRQPKQFEKLFSKASKEGQILTSYFSIRISSNYFVFEAIDLLRKLLTFDFTKRITVEEALQHPYLAELHFPEDEVKKEKKKTMIRKL